jgi:hypothetical protein
MAADVAATEKTAAYNEKRMNDPEDYFAADGRRGMVWRNLKENNGGYYDKYVVTDLEGKDTELKTDEEKEQFNREFRNADSEKQRTAIDTAQKKRKEALQEQPKTTVMVGKTPYKISTALSMFNSFTSKLQVKGSGALDFLSAFANIKEGEKFDTTTFDQAGKQSALAQITEMKNSKDPVVKKAAENWFMFYNALFGDGGGGGGVKAEIDISMDNIKKQGIKP